MIPLPDGTLRYSPRDVLASLEGDFAAWCERMLAERQRDGGAGSDPIEWVSPDEGDEEAALAKRKGDEHEQRWLELFRARHSTIVEIDRADPEGVARTLAAMEAGAPVIYEAHLVAGGWGGYWVPVDHDGCEQKSDEECERIAAIVADLLSCRVVDRHGVERHMAENDILVVTRSTSRCSHTGPTAPPQHHPHFDADTVPWSSPAA